jgi:hypothetical protein
MEPPSELDAVGIVESLTMAYGQYGSFDPKPDEKQQHPPTNDSERTCDVTDSESEVTHALLDQTNARYSLRCIFHQEAWDEGTATMGNEILNLVKNIVGSGGVVVASRHCGIWICTDCYTSRTRPYSTHGCPQRIFLFIAGPSLCCDAQQDLSGGVGPDLWETIWYPIQSLGWTRRDGQGSFGMLVV